jgi:hypothetical protein
MRYLLYANHNNNRPDPDIVIYQILNTVGPGENPVENDDGEIEDREGFDAVLILSPHSIQIGREEFIGDWDSDILSTDASLKEVIHTVFVMKFEK